jgi:regulator of nonsense transcripts 1
MKLKALTLRERAPNTPEEVEWKFNIPPNYMAVGLRREKMLKITFSDAGIVLDTDKISSNRILHSDDPTKFILLGVKRSFRFPDHPPKITTEYLIRFFKVGLFLNGVQYRFYHHSNSQLVSVSHIHALSY